MDLGLWTFVNHQPGILAAIIRVWDNRKVCTNRRGIADLLDTARLLEKCVYVAQRSVLRCAERIWCIEREACMAV